MPIPKICIMTKSLEELIDVAFRIKVHLSVGSYEFHHYDENSYVDFRTRYIKDPLALLRIAHGLQLYIFADNDSVIVRLYEREQS